MKEQVTNNIFYRIPPVDCFCIAPSSVGNGKITKLKPKDNNNLCP